MNTGSDPISILIVDDEPGNLVVLETVLEDPGYRLVRAQTADEALLRLVEEEFALLILDIRMPDMSGFELAQMIKERKKTASVPIIFLTAYYDTDQHVLQGYGSGAVDFLNKPVNPAVLRSKVSVFADLARKNRTISQVNTALTAEIQERRGAEERLRELNETLERRVVERTEALRRADSRLQAMMDSITDGLLMLDAEWRFTYCNDQGARLLGRSREQLLGTSVWAFFPLGTPFESSFRQAMSTRHTVSFEAHYPPPAERWWECRCFPSDDGLSVYFHDVTDRREVEARREQLLGAEQAARAEGERVARAKDEFLALLSHELRTPLAAIMGWTTVLERTDVDASTLRRGLDAIGRNARAQSQLVNDLLDVSRIVSGKLRMNIEAVDVDAIAAAAADTARPAFQAKGVHIEAQLAAGAWGSFLGDPTRLQQIVSNLLNNALKFTAPGGTVTIATDGDDAHIALSVTDTGEGIAPEFIPRLFDRFSQADASAARVHGGIGLGLSIVKNLVELHAGTVTASSPGKGLGASFTLRVARAANRAAFQTLPGDAGDAETPAGPSTAAARSDRHQHDLSGVSVLLVDDHPDMLEIERRLLTDCGARVTTADSAEQALRALRDAPFDVLLSDLGLPGMDGYQFIETVRALPGMGADRLPAAAVTAFARAEDRQRALRAGYQGYLVKPVSPTALAGLVHDLARLTATPPGARQAGAEPKGVEPASDGSSGTTAAASVPADGSADATAAPSADAGGRRLRALFVEDNADLREQIGWLLGDAAVDVVACANGEDAEVEFSKGGIDVVVTDIGLPRMSGVELARRVLTQSPQAWVVFLSGYPMDGGLSMFGPHVRALMKPFEIDDLYRLLDEVREGLSLAPAAPRGVSSPA